MRPDDVALRTRLISYYFQNMIREPRARHILWMIENHAEADVFRAVALTDLAPNWSGMNEMATYEWSRNLWLNHTGKAIVDHRLLMNAAIALAAADPQISLELIRRGRKAEPANSLWLRWLASTYSLAVRTSIAGAWQNLRAFAGPVRGRDVPPAVRLPLADSERLKNELESSTDLSLVRETGEALVREMDLLGESSPAPDVRASRTFGEHLLSRVTRAKRRPAR